MWGPRWEGITKDSPEHGRTVLVDIYRLRCWVAYGGVVNRSGKHTRLVTPEVSQGPRITASGDRSLIGRSPSALDTATAV